MEKEPLLQPAISFKRPPSLPPHLLKRTDQDEFTIPMTPSEFKERLIFGPSPSAQDKSPFLDALNLSADSPRPSIPYAPQDSPFRPELPNQQPLLADPNFSWNKTHLHRSKTAPAMSVIKDITPHSPAVRPELNSQSTVRQAFILLVVYLSFGVVVFWLNRDAFSGSETHPVVDALYFCIVTMCTIGYGDITPTSTATKLFSIMFVLVGFGFIDILLSGMVCYVLDLQENYLLRTVKEPHIIDVKKGRMRIRMKVALALGVVVFCIGMGMGAMHFMEHFGWLDSFYLSVMSVTTVGYGDQTFKSTPGRIFASIWLLVSTLAVARAFLYFAEARVDRRNRKMAKWILDQNLTVSEFLAADIDHDGYVSKSEYVIYKLKEMGKAAEKDIMTICRNFDRLDTGNCGKITLSDLLESQ